MHDGTTLIGFFYRCTAPLNDDAWCSGFLAGLCSAIDMIRVGGPWTARVESLEEPEDSGVSAVMVIAESHLAIHTWPAKSAARVVIDSCRVFNARKASDWIGQALDADYGDVHELGGPFGYGVPMFRWRKDK